MMLRLLKLLISVLARLPGDVHGGALVTSALMLPAMVGATGLAVDVAMWRTTQLDIQAAADAAALAGAHEMARAGATDPQIIAAARTDAAKNGFAHGSSITVSVMIASESKRVTVTIDTRVPLMLASAVMSMNPLVRARAVAGKTGGTPICLLALDTSASGAIHLDSNARLTANGCTVQSNSSSNQGLSTNSNATASAEKFCVAGDFSGNGFSPLPQTGCSPKTDPLANLEAPNSETCDHNDYELSGGSAVLSPGVYCGGITVDSNASVTLQPGTYVIKNGELNIDSNATLAGTGVTFYLTGNDAVIDFNSNSTVNVTAPSDGAYAGIAFYADRNAPNGLEHTLNSNGSLTVEGVIYLPNGHLQIDSNGAANTNAAFTTVIARTIHLNSNGELVLNSDYEATGTPVPPMLVGGVALLE